MTDELDTTQVAQDDPQADPQVDPDADPQVEPKPFSKEQEQYIGSWLGRMVAKQLEEKVIPIINEKIPQHEPYSPPPQENVLEKFNEEMSGQLFTDPYGAFKRMMDVYQGTQTNLSKTQKTQVDKNLLTYSKTPYYKEIFGNMQTIAHNAVGQGYPPEAAAEYAYQKARAEHLDKKPDADNLDMLSGGISQKRIKTVKLPPQFKAAFERDKEAGIFKTEQEFVDNLSPKVRQELGL